MNSQYSGVYKEIFPEKDGDVRICEDRKFAKVGMESLGETVVLGLLF